MGTLRSPSFSRLARGRALLLLSFVAGGQADQSGDRGNKEKALAAEQLVANRRLTATSVASFNELETALETVVAGGDALIDVSVGTVTFTSVVPVANGTTIEIKSTVAAELSGGSTIQLLLVNGDLTLRALSLAGGAASTNACDEPYTDCAGGAIYVSATGSLKLVECVVENNVARVRAGCVRGALLQ